MNAPSKINFASPVLLRLGEVYLCLGLFIFFTGFTPSWLLSPKTIAAYPLYHRIYVTGIFLSSILYLKTLWTLRTQKNFPPSFLQRSLEGCLSKPQILLWILFAVLSVTWTLASWIRHDALHSSFDLAIFVQAIWNTTQGDWFYSSIKGGICLMGDHFSPFLAFFSIPYKLWPDPKNLLLMQSLGAASSVIPLYHLSKLRLQSTNAALAFVLAFALYLPMRNAVRFDFHPEVAGIAIWFWAYFFMVQKQYLQASLALLLGLLLKENAAGPAAALGLLILMNRQWKLGLFWTFIPVLYLIACIHWIIPYFNQEPYFYWSGNFGAWKDQGAGALIKHFLRPESLAYLIKIFAPLALFSFFSPTYFVLTLPALAQNLLSRNEMTHSIFFHYTAFLIPGVFISAVEGARRFMSQSKQPLLTLKKTTWALVLASILMAGVSDIYIATQAWLQRTPQSEAVHRFLRNSPIPPEASVRTHEFLAPHFANRKHLFIYENNHPREGASLQAKQADYVILLSSLLSSNFQAEIQALKDLGYRLQSDSDEIFIFKRESSL